MAAVNPIAQMSIPGTNPVLAVENAFQRISSFDQNPAKSGMGAAVIARQEIK